MELSRQELLEWVAVLFSRGSSQPRDWTRVSHIAGGVFVIWATKEEWDPQRPGHPSAQPQTVYPARFGLRPVALSPIPRQQPSGFCPETEDCRSEARSSFFLQLEGSGQGILPPPWPYRALSPPTAPSAAGPPAHRVVFPLLSPLLRNSLKGIWKLLSDRVFPAVSVSNWAGKGHEGSLGYAFIPGLSFISFPSLFPLALPVLCHKVAGLLELFLISF